MKLLINNKYEEVGFWSFVKCFVLTELAILGIIYAAIFLLGIILGFSGYYAIPPSISP